MHTAKPYNIENNINIPIQLPDLTTGNWALFLDLDGTLAAIAPTPKDAFIPLDILQAIQVIHEHLGQALAIVSGRTLSDIDNLCGGPRYTAAGQHGLEIRYTDGHIMQVECDSLLQPAKDAATELQNAHPDLLLEYKSMGLAVHYRQVPELAVEVQTKLTALVDRHPELQLQHGKMVTEIRLAGANKGTAIIELMEEIPFFGKTPIFIGDDITDEDGFAAINKLGGISIKLGHGDTSAQIQLSGTEPLHDWLLSNAKRFQGANV